MTISIKDKLPTPYVSRIKPTVHKIRTLRIILWVKLPYHEDGGSRFLLNVGKYQAYQQI
jgi:hypothetical protein